MARTNNLSNFLTDVADAIRTKKGSEELIAAEDFDTEIENLPSGGDLSEYFSSTISSSTNQTTWTKYGWLDSIKKLPAIQLNLTNGDASNLYTTCGAEEIELDAFENVTLKNLSSMFFNCIDVKILDFSFFDTSQVTNMGYMFANCKSLEALDLSSFTSSKLTTCWQMFTGCVNLLKIDIRNFDLSNRITNNTNMFGANASNGVPDNCEIIAKDDTAKAWITSKWSRLTNVKTVAEYEAEQNA